VSLLSQLPRAIRLARSGGIDGVARCARRDGDRERGQELAAPGTPHGRSGFLGLSGRVIRVRRERRDLVGSPDAQRHRGKDVLELGGIVGGEQAERAPFAWL
jgi:hypothetical protein